MINNLKPMNENLWFKEHQSLLLAIVNHPDGRDLLCIDKNYPHIIEISKSHITCFLDINNKGQIIKLSDFRTGAKWANIIRYRWPDFAKMAKAFYSHPEFNLHKHDISGRLAATTSTFYPDPGPTETDTVDGMVRRTGVDESLSTLRSGAGSDAFDNSNPQDAIQLNASTTSNQYAQMRRVIALFDATSMSGDFISSGTLSLTLSSKANGGSPILNGTSESSKIVASVAAPATNTALVAGDYNQIGLTTEFGRSDTYDNLALEAYEDISLNASGLSNISGISGFGLTFGFDFDNSTADLTWGSGDSVRLTPYFAEETGTSKDPKLVVIHAVSVPIEGGVLTTASTMPAPTITGKALVSGGVLTTTSILPEGFAQTVLIQGGVLSVSTTMPVPTVELPSIVVGGVFAVTVSMPPANILADTRLIAVDGFPSGKTVSYSILDIQGNILQDFTTVGVSERVIDATAGKSQYVVLSNLATGISQVSILWKTNDAIPLTASEITELGAHQIAAVQRDVTAIKLKTDNLPDGVLKNTALDNFTFFMADSIDHISGKLGLTVTCERSLNGLAFEACDNSATELSNGVYIIDLTADDMNGDTVTLRFSATGADDRIITMVTQT